MYLSRKRDTKDAKRFLKKTLASGHTTKPRSITANDHKACSVAIRELKEKKCITHSMPLRVKKYLNNITFLSKKQIQNMLELKSLQTATKMIAGIENIHIIKKGQTPKEKNLTK